jgi:hypothetical protein
MERDREIKAKDTTHDQTGEQIRPPSVTTKEQYHGSTTGMTNANELFGWDFPISNLTYRNVS